MKLDLHVKEHRLEAFRFGVNRAISRYELQDIAPSLELEVFERSGAEMVMQLCATLYGRRNEGQEIRYPATWWDAVKLRWFPAWLLRRYPPVHVVHKTVETELFPNVAPIPGQRSLVLREFEPVRLLP